MNNQPKAIKISDVFKEDIKRIEVEIQALQERKVAYLKGLDEQKIEDEEISTCNENYSFQDCYNRLELIMYYLNDAINKYLEAEKSKESIVLSLNYFDCLKYLKNKFLMLMRALKTLNMDTYLGFIELTNEHCPFLLKQCNIDRFNKVPHL